MGAFPVGLVNSDATLPLSETTTHLMRSVPGVERVETLVVNVADRKPPNGAIRVAQMTG
jgi:hypothetical protein